MHRYKVLRSSADRNEVVLTDDQGRHHLARPIRYVPEVGIPLLGPHPLLGLGVLLDADNRRAYKLIFEQLDWDGPADLPAAR